MLKDLSTALLSTAMLICAPQAHAQSGAELNAFAAACNTSVETCRATVARFRPQIASLTMAQRRSVVASFVATVKFEISTASPKIMKSYGAMLEDLLPDITDGEQRRAVACVAAQLSRGVLNNPSTFEEAVDAVIRRALSPGNDK